MLKLTCKSR